MFLITTATGKQFQSDFANAPHSAEFAFVRVVNSNYSTVHSVFSNPEELPIDVCQTFLHVNSINDVGDAIEIILKH